MPNSLELSPCAYVSERSMRKVFYCHQELDPIDLYLDREGDVKLRDDL